MNISIATRTRSSYTGSRLTTSKLLKGLGGNPDYDYFVVLGGRKPWQTANLRTLFEESSLDATGNTRGTWNDFEHYKMSGTFPSSEYTYWTPMLGTTKGWTMQYDDPGMCYPTSSPWGSQDNPTVGLPLLYVKNPVTGHFVPDVTGQDTLINSAVRSMLGSIRPNLSLINSIIELKDIKGLPRTISRVRLTLQGLQKTVPKLLNPSYVGSRSRRSLLDILGTAADIFLQQEFNIKPLIRDLEGIRDSVYDLQTALRKRMRDEGVVRRRDFNATLPGYADSFAETADAAYSESGVYADAATEPRKFLGLTRLSRSVRYQQARFHAQVEYSQYWSQYQKQNAMMLALLDRLGVYFNPSVLWNAIPWSFAVDWVMSVNSWLDQFALTNTEPVTIVHKFCWSTLRVRTIAVTMKYQTGLGSLWSPSSRAASYITEQSYRRSTQGLNIIASLSGTGISPKEFILGSALALSRRRRKK